MTDSNPGGVTVRVPDWLADELEKIVTSFPRGQRPTRGDVLSQAWLKLKSIPTSSDAVDDSTHLQKGSSTLTLKGAVTESVADALKKASHGTNPPTEKELPWLMMTLRVIRSVKPGLSEALKSNLIQFDDAAEEWDERKGRRTSDKDRARKQTRIDPERQRPTPIGGGGGEAEERESRVFAELHKMLDKIAERKARKQTGTEGDDEKAR